MGDSTSDSAPALFSLAVTNEYKNAAEIRRQILENSSAEAVIKGTGIAQEVYLLKQNALVVGGEGGNLMKQKAEELSKLGAAMQKQYANIYNKVANERPWETEIEIAEVANSFARAETALYKNLIDGKYPAIGLAQKVANIQTTNAQKIANGTI